MTSRELVRYMFINYFRIFEKIRKVEKQVIPWESNDSTFSDSEEEISE